MAVSAGLRQKGLIQTPYRPHRGLQAVLPVDNSATALDNIIPSFILVLPCAVIHGGRILIQQFVMGLVLLQQRSEDAAYSREPMISTVNESSATPRDAPPAVSHHQQVALVAAYP